MSDRFKVISVAELLASPIKVTFEQVKEERAAGFREGYMLAMKLVDELIKAGYQRPNEISNVLWENNMQVTRWKAYEPWPRPSITPWAELREQVFERDGRLCALCTSTDDLQIDHVTPVKEGGLPLISNLRVLCATCNCARNRKGAP